MTELKDFVSLSARIMAALRARETERLDRLFEDPFAAQLAGPEAFGFLEQRKHKHINEDEGSLYVAVRTRFFDDFLISVMSELRQVVIVGAGMDTRAFRLPWSSLTDVYEVEQSEVLARKESILKNTLPTCNRHVLAVDLTQPWLHLLVELGYQAELRSVWLLEGLLMYLTKVEVHELLSTISRVAAQGSLLGADLINTQSLQDEDVAKYWRSGFDHPEQLFASYGWDAEVVQPGDEGANFGRYAQPLPPRDVADVRRAFLVKARKKAS